MSLGSSGGEAYFADLIQINFHPRFAATKFPTALFRFFPPAYNADIALHKDR
jgi:hypothetical protein